MDSLTGPDGTVYSIFDLRRLYEMRRELLTKQRADAIEAFLYHDLREQDAAVAMGLPPEASVAIYATQGLKQLAAAWSEGIMWRRDDEYAVPAGADEAAQRDLQGAGSPG